MRHVFVLLLLAQGLAGCNSSRSPVAPSALPMAVAQPAPQPAPQPTGTQVAGIVYDTAYRPLAGAKVEVVDGPQAGTSTIADAKGEYRLAGTFDDTTRFRATKDGHLEATGTRGPRCDRCNPNWWLYFHLSVLAPPVNIAGDYTLTFTADGACAALPSEARARTYAATIVPAPPSAFPADTRFEVSVSGAPFVASYKSFPIHVAGDYVSGWLGDLHGDPGLVEQIAPKKYVALSGWIEGSAAGASTISGSLDGVVESCELKSDMGAYYDCSPAQAVAHAQCVSTKHRLILTRR